MSKKTPKRETADLSAPAAETLAIQHATVPAPDQAGPDASKVSIGQAARAPGSGGPVAWLRTNVFVLLTPSMMLLAQLANLLTYHHYDLWRPEVLLVASLFTGLGLILGLICAVRNRALCGIVILLLMLAVGDLYSQEYNLLDYLEWRNGQKATVFLSIAGFLILAFLIQPFVRHLSTVLFIFMFFFSTFLAMILLGQGDDRLNETRADNVSVDATLPPVIHIVTDEMIGLDGIPTSIEGATELRRDLADFYQSWGFRVYAKAFSRFSMTPSSLTTLLNGSSLPDDDHRFISGPDGSFLSRNLWFETRQEAGYVIRSYQMNHLDFCRPENLRVESCFQYWPSSIKLLDDVALEPLAKARVLIAAYLDNSDLLMKLRPWLAPEDLLLGPIASESILQRIGDDVGRLGGGRLYFAHLLSPHYSYVYTQDCRPKPEIDRWVAAFRFGEKYDFLRNNEESRARRYQEYFKQVRCLHLLLNRFFAKLAQNGILAEATVIIHGDHGSRIAMGATYGGFRQMLSERDLIDHFSTHLAIRKPGLEAGRDDRRDSIQAIFDKHFLSGTEREPDTTVFLREDEGHPLGDVEVEMPEIK